jgi:hypothetical protein
MPEIMWPERPETGSLDGGIPMATSPSRHPQWSAFWGCEHESTRIGRRVGGEVVVEGSRNRSRQREDPASGPRLGWSEEEMTGDLNADFCDLYPTLEDVDAATA